MSKVFPVRYFTRTKNFQNHRLYSYYHILVYDPYGRYRLVERSAVISYCPYRRVASKIGLCAPGIPLQPSISGARDVTTSNFFITRSLTLAEGGAWIRQ